MTTVSYSSYSMYYSTPLSPNSRYLDLWVPRTVPANKSDKTMTINETYNQRPDLLAHDLYGDARLCWVFAQRNPNTLASDPLGNFVTGTVIFLPDATALKSALGLS
jgi:hypothetical protein